MSQPLALLLSILIEAAVAAGLVAALRWAPAWRAALAAAAGTLVTHWAVWAGMPPLTAAIGYWWALPVVEGLVVLAETLAYRLVARLSWPRALLVSFLANAASTAAGLLIWWLRTRSL